MFQNNSSENVRGVWETKVPMFFTQMDRQGDSSIFPLDAQDYGYSLPVSE